MQARRRKPKKGNVQQIRRPNLSKWSSLSLSLSLLAFSKTMYQGFLSLYLAQAAFLGYGNVYMPALCMMYVCMYVYMYIYIYICLLVDDYVLCMMDSHGQKSDPLIIMSSLDLVVWVCAQGDCYRCIFMLHCAYDHRGVIVSIPVASDIGYLVYATRIRMLDVLRGFCSS